MLTIPVYTTGLVVAGPARGHFIRVDDDSKASDGMIVIASPIQTSQVRQWDVWVPEFRCG